MSFGGTKWFAKCWGTFGSRAKCLNICRTSRVANKVTNKVLCTMANEVFCKVAKEHVANTVFCKMF